MPVRAQSQTGWATFVAMKDAFDQCLYRPQVEVAGEVLRAPGPSNRPREGRPAPSPQQGVEGRIRPQRRNSGGPQAQVAGPRRPLYRKTPGRGDSVGEGRGHPHGPRATEGVEGDGGKGGFAELANWVVPPPGHGSTWGAPPGQPTPSTTPAAVSEGGGGFQWCR